VSGPPGWVRAVAVDFDGTLTPGGRPPEPVLDALADARRRGIAVILATGRIMGELEAVFPDVAAHVDLLVTEDGAVLGGPGGSRHLADPLPAALDAELARRGVPFRRGEVIVATLATHRDAVADAVAASGAAASLIRNRGELMAVPAGVGKGAGVRAALAVLGISHHNAVAIGDAENDLSMLMAVEIGAAPANAVSAVRSAADLHVAGDADVGVTELLDPDTLAAAGRRHPRRWAVPVGRSPHGGTVTIPGSRVMVLVNGPSRSGKSHLAGHLAERIARAGDTLLVIDPEGDHGGLAEVPGVVVLGTSGPVPPAARVLELLASGERSVVLDLSLTAAAVRRGLLGELLPAVQARRRRGGPPHWLLVDEAHEVLCGPRPALVPEDAPSAASLLVTYVPEHLPARVRAAADVEILLSGATGPAGPHPVPHDALEELGRLGAGHALVVGPQVPGHCAPVRVASHGLRHVRHWHKYVAAELPDVHRFMFRWPDGAPTGEVATNVVEFHDLLRAAPAESVEHHCRGRDISRWVREVMGDRALAGPLEAVEARAGEADAETTREALLAAVEARYLRPVTDDAHTGRPDR